MIIEKDFFIEQNFKMSEFVCKCGKNHVYFGDFKNVWKLQQIRNMIGKPINITSAYRCPDYNEKVGGVYNSRHVFGLAFDLQCDGDLLEIARVGKMFFNGVGIYDNFIHLDSRPVKAFWNDSKKFERIKGLEDL